MSIAARDAVLAYIGDDGPGATLSVGQKLVLIDLADVGDEHGISFLSERVQAKRLGVARSSVQAARAALSDHGPLCVAEEVPGRAPMLWIELPGLDGDTAESWSRRRDRRPRGGPAAGPPRHDDGRPGGPVDERGGGPVTGQGGPATGPGVARLTRDDPLVDPLVDRLADTLEADRSPSNQEDDNGNVNTGKEGNRDPEGDANGSGDSQPLPAAVVPEVKPASAEQLAKLDSLRQKCGIAKKLHPESFEEASNLLGALESANTPWALEQVRKMAHARAGIDDVLDEEPGR